MFKTSYLFIKSPLQQVSQESVITFILVLQFYQLWLVYLKSIHETDRIKKTVIILIVGFMVDCLSVLQF